MNTPKTALLESLKRNPSRQRKIQNWSFINGNLRGQSTLETLISLPLILSFVGTLLASLVYFFFEVHWTHLKNEHEVCRNSQVSASHCNAIANLKLRKLSQALGLKVIASPGFTDSKDWKILSTWSGGESLGMSSKVLIHENSP